MFTWVAAAFSFTRTQSTVTECCSSLIVAFMWLECLPALCCGSTAPMGQIFYHEKCHSVSVSQFLSPTCCVFSLSTFLCLCFSMFLLISSSLYLFVSLLQQPSSSVPSLSASVAQQAVKLQGQEDRKREGGKLKDKMKGKNVEIHRKRWDF